MTYEYSLLQWVLVFYIYCFLGWCFETTVVSVQKRRFVNRGFLKIPMLPIYGFGATMLLYISLPLYNKPILLFIASFVAATVFEYIVGAVMETLFKVRYWDYSTHKFQLNGYICLQSSVCWGVMGLILARFIHPPVEYIVVSLSAPWLLVFALLISVIFVWDTLISVRAALDLAKVLEELDKLREQGVQLQKQLTETAKVKLTNMSYRMEETKDEWTEKLEETKAQYQKRMEQWQRQYERKMRDAIRSRKGVIRGNPSATSKRYSEMFKQIRERIEQGRNG